MNSPEYTTSAPVIGPLIMCSGLRVSAKPYHPRHRVAPSSRVVVARQSIDRSLESRLVSFSLARRLLASSPRASFPSSLIHHPSSSRVVSVASSRSRRSRLSRRSHREHESPIRHRSPKMRRLRSRRSVDEGTNRHDRAVSVLSVPRRALPPRGRLSVSQSSITLCRACAVCPHCANGDARDGESVERTRDHEMERVWGRRDRCRSRMRRRRGTHGARDECDACMT